MFFLQKNLVFSTPGDPLNRGKKSDFFSSTLALSPRSSSFYPLLLTFPYLEVIQDLKNATFGVNNTAEAQKLAKLHQFPFFLLLLLSISCQIKLLLGDTIQVFIYKSIDSSRRQWQKQQQQQRVVVVVVVTCESANFVVVYCYSILLYYYEIC